MLETFPGVGCVLVAEDDECILMLIRTILVRAGFSVDTARDGAEALEKIAAERYDVVVLDLMMPRVSGFDVLLQLAMLDRPPGVVVTSAMSRDQLLRLKSFAVFAVLQKPFEIGALITAVNACFEAERKRPVPRAVSRTVAS